MAPKCCPIKQSAESADDSTMEPTAVAPELSPVSPIREAAASSVLLRPVSGWLAGLYAVLAVTQPLVIADWGWILAGGSAVSAVILGLVARYSPRIPLGAANATLAGVLFIAVLNSSAHLLLSREIWQLTNLMLVVIGAGMALIPLRWNLLVVIACWLPVGYAVLTFGGASPAHWIIAMLLATLVGQLARHTRANALTSAAKAMAEVDAISTHDEMTGLPNRRGLDRAGAQLLQQAARDHQPCTAYLVDLAGLRDCGERFGLDAVDEAIVGTGRAIEASAPQGAIVGRWNWDHFLVIVLGRGPTAEQMQTRILARLNAAQNGHSLLWPPDISVGDALAKPGPDSSITELIWRADHELYARKRSRVDPPRASGHPQHPTISVSDLNDR